MSVGVTGAIIARDEAAHLGACLDTLSWADDRLVVLDDRTADDSASIARSKGARVVERRFRTFPIQRNAALDLATTPWILFVDADERVTPSLAAEVRRAIVSPGEPAPAGYWIPRRNFIWGGWIRHGGWYPDYQLRLLNVGRARYDEQRDVHELVRLAGEDAYLSEALIHYNYDRLDQFFAKQRFYTSLEAERLARAGQRARPRNFALQPIRELRRRFVELEGWRDGWRGLLLATLLAWYTGVTYAKLATVGVRGSATGFAVQSEET